MEPLENHDSLVFKAVVEASIAEHLDFIQGFLPSCSRKDAMYVMLMINCRLQNLCAEVVAYYDRGDDIGEFCNDKIKTLIYIDKHLKQSYDL